MSARWKAVVVCALATSVACQAENVITVWEATGTYTVRQDLATVEITSDGDFKIQATGDYGGLAVR
jgi:hypothetical protein